MVLTDAVSTLSARVLLFALRSRGIDLGDVLVELGIPRNGMMDPDELLPRAVMERLWRAAEERWGQADLGIYLARKMGWNPNSMAICIVQNSRDLRHAYPLWARYRQLMSPGVDQRLEIGDDQARLVIPPASPSLPCAWTEFVLAQAIRLVREFTAREDVGIMAVSLRRVHPDEALRAAAAAFFGVPVRFGADEDVVTLAAEALDYAFVSSAHNLAVVEALARDTSEVLPTLDAVDAVDATDTTVPLVSQVRAGIVHLLLEGDPTADTIAARLNMSQASLEHQLAQAGTSYQEILDELRLALATRYLTSQRSSIVEIAFLLGFSTMSELHRAFHRWTGSSPRAYADQLLRNQAAESSLPGRDTSRTDRDELA